MALIGGLSDSCLASARLCVTFVEAKARSLAWHEALCNKKDLTENRNWRNCGIKQVSGV